MYRKEHISLLNLDLSDNKWRMYRIEALFPDGPAGAYTVTLSWGRMNSYRRTQVQVFDEKEEMLQFIEGVLKRRKRHGYKTTEKSEGFPSSPTLQELEYAEYLGQLTLF